MRDTPITERRQGFYIVRDGFPAVALAEALDRRFNLGEDVRQIAKHCQPERLLPPREMSLPASEMCRTPGIAVTATLLLPPRQIFLYDFCHRTCLMTIARPGRWTVSQADLSVFILKALRHAEGFRMRVHPYKELASTVHVDEPALIFPTGLRFRAYTSH